MKLEVFNRFTGAVQLTAEINAAEDESRSVKLGLAVKWAISTRAALSGADLRDADLRGAALSGADLSGADLSGADLRGAALRGADLRDADLRDADLSGADLRDADLRGADLRAFKADMWLTLSQAGPDHVSHLIAQLKAGNVDGSTYGDGRECACLVGTLANHGATGLERRSSNPAERWFMMIRPGDKPGDDTGGGFAAKMALEWAEGWMADHSQVQEGDNP